MRKKLRRHSLLARPLAETNRAWSDMLRRLADR